MKRFHLYQKDESVIRTKIDRPMKFLEIQAWKSERGMRGH
jgi:hypothetical protein